MSPRSMHVLMYSEMADLDDRWDMTDAQKTTARTQLLWSVVVIKRRQTSALANGGLARALLSQAAPVSDAAGSQAAAAVRGPATKYRATLQRFGLD